MTSVARNPVLNSAQTIPGALRTELQDARLEVFGRDFRALSGSLKLSGGTVSGTARIVATARPSTLGSSVYLRTDDLACVLTTFEVLDARGGQFLVQFAGYVCEDAPAAQA
jgi:hypothetical protein